VRLSEAAEEGDVLTDREFGLPGVSLRAGDHICALYRTERDRDQIMFPFLGAGLEAGDKCICVVDSMRPSDVLRGLGDHSDTAAWIASGQLDVHHATEAYLRADRFSKDEMLAFWRDRAGVTVVDDRFPFVRVAGEMPWALREQPHWAEFVSYESASTTSFRSIRWRSSACTTSRSWWRRHRRSAQSAPQAAARWLHAREPSIHTP
jgi:DcmR-like sensory protein